MAKEYIERNALIAEYDRVHVGAPGGARKLMVEAPAADVVEVVRCEDCIGYKKSQREGYIGGICMFTHSGVFEKDFCSRGERKEADQ